MGIGVVREGLNKSAGVGVDRVRSKALAAPVKIGWINAGPRVESIRDDLAIMRQRPLPPSATPRLPNHSLHAARHRPDSDPQFIVRSTTSIAPDRGTGHRSAGRGAHIDLGARVGHLIASASADTVETQEPSSSLWPNHHRHDVRAFRRSRRRGWWRWRWLALSTDQARTRSPDDPHQHRRRRQQQWRRTGWPPLRPPSPPAAIRASASAPVRILRAPPTRWGRGRGRGRALVVVEQAPHGRPEPQRQPQPQLQRQPGPQWEQQRRQRQRPQ